MPERELKNWLDWGLSEKPTLINTYTQGKNHRTGLIESAGTKYVLKRFEHSFNAAVHAQQCAATHHVAPKIIYYGNNTAIMEYLPGGLPSLNHTATALRTLHTEVTHKTEGLALMSCYEQYLESATEGLRKRHQLLLPILQEFIDDPTPWCFCHNDLVNENCLSQNEHAVFIDWEYAAQHNPWFDLAAIVLYQDLDHTQASQFLRHYRGWQSKLHERVFLTSQIALLWGDLLWHTHKYGPDYQHQQPARFKQLTNFTSQLTGS